MMKVPHDKPLKILFVCLANLCRSPMAKAIAQKFFGEMVYAESAGIAPATGPVFKEAAEVVYDFYGADITGHKTRHVLKYPVAEFDYIIAMDRPVYMALALWKSIPKEKLHTWEIPDPSGLGIEAYEQTARRIELELEKFLDGREMEKGFPGPQAQNPE